MSHKDAKVVKSIIASLNTKYGAIMPLSISCCKIYECLGMTFEFINKGKVMTTMYNHIDNVIDKVPEI